MKAVTFHTRATSPEEGGPAEDENASQRDAPRSRRGQWKSSAPDAAARCRVNAGGAGEQRRRGAGPEPRRESAREISALQRYDRGDHEQHGLRPPEARAADDGEQREFRKRYRYQHQTVLAQAEDGAADQIAKENK
ncbi:MAG: hypothetical protein ACI4XG_23145 [Bradyrhizobium sp.]